jgi:DNA-binding response OmpR family regulator
MTTAASTDSIPSVPVKVLVVDDSATVRQLVRARLLADGFDVVEADDGEDALALVRAEHPALVVLDKVMPKLDGFEVIRLLRGSQDTRAIPIVMLTERTSESDVLDGLELGAEEYIAKPFSPRELSLRVQRALARSPQAS